jgi:peroxiredoxin
MNRTILTMLIILAVSIMIFSGCESKSPGDDPKPGKIAPGFTLINYDGKTISLSDYKGKIVVLEWFNYECPFVKYHYEKVKTMTTLADKYKDKSVVWLAINSTSHLMADKNKEFVDQYRISYPILDDKTGRTGRAYGAKTTPHMFIVDTGGKIAYSGAIDNSPLDEKKEGVINYVDKALLELTMDKSVRISNTAPYGCSVKYAN